MLNNTSELVNYANIGVALSTNNPLVQQAGGFVSQLRKVPCALGQFAICSHYSIRHFFVELIMNLNTFQRHVVSRDAVLSFSEADGCDYKLRTKL